MYFHRNETTNYDVDSMIVEDLHFCVLDGAGTPEVHSARSKLDGLLQTLVEKQEETYVYSSVTNIK